MTTRLDQTLAFHSQALNVRTYRQQILAANIANADTPNYKARDVEFGSALRDALAGRGNGALPMATTATGHLSGGGMSASPSLLFRTPSQASADGNTVDMDIERAQFAENAVRYEATISFVNSQLRAMLDAMQPAR